MPKEQKVTCDHCGKECGPPYYELDVTIRSRTEPQINRDLSFCSVSCAAAWFSQWGRG